MAVNVVNYRLKITIRKEIFMRISRHILALLLVFSVCIGMCSCMTVDVRPADSSSGGNGIIDDPFGMGDPFSAGGSSSGQSQGSPVTPTPGATSPTDSEVPTENGSADPSADPLSMTKQELIDYFNENLNKIKSDFPAFNRAKQTLVKDIVLSNGLANSLVSVVKDALLSEEVETKTATKGQSNMELMSPDGERFVSQLTLSDVKDISVTSQGGNYIVTVLLPDAVNPDKESGAYAKIFNFITVDDVVNTYAPKVGAKVERSNIKVNYSGCYAKAMFSPDGRVLAYETYVTCVMSLNEASITVIKTDVDITLASTTRFTDFSY